MAEMIKMRTGNHKAEWSEDALIILEEFATAKVQGRPGAFSTAHPPPRRRGVSAASKPSLCARPIRPYPIPSLSPLDEWSK